MGNGLKPVYVARLPVYVARRPLYVVRLPLLSIIIERVAAVQGWLLPLRITACCRLVSGIKL